MKGEERREQVLACAREVFAERGYHQTTVEQIVSRAGVARGTFYLYFGDKRSIFDELLERFMAELRAAIVRIDPSVGVEEGWRLVRRNVQGVIRVMLEQRELTKILLSDAVGLDPEFDRKLLDFYAGLTDLLERSLETGQRIGIVRACDARLVAMFVIGALKEFMYQVTMRGYEPDVERVVDEFLAYFREGLIVLGRKRESNEGEPA